MNQIINGKKEGYWKEMRFWFQPVKPVIVNSFYKNGKLKGWSKIYDVTEKILLLSVYHL